MTADKLYYNFGIVYYAKVVECVFLFRSFTFFIVTWLKLKAMPRSLMPHLKHKVTQLQYRELRAANKTKTAYIHLVWCVQISKKCNFHMLKLAVFSDKFVVKLSQIYRSSTFSMIKKFGCDFADFYKVFTVSTIFWNI